MTSGDITPYMQVMNFIETTTPLFNLAATMIVAFTAWRGITLWRQETLGKKKIELAEELLLTFKKVEKAIGVVRFPASYISLDDLEKPYAQNVINHYKKNFEENGELFAKVEALRYRATLYWPDTEEAFKKIDKVFWNINHSLRQLINIYWVKNGSYSESNMDEETRTKHEGKRQEHEHVIWSQDNENDKIAALMSEAVKNVEVVCMPIIRE